MVHFAHCGFCSIKLSLKRLMEQNIKGMVAVKFEYSNSYYCPRERRKKNGKQEYIISSIYK